MAKIPLNAFENRLIRFWRNEAPEQKKLALLVSGGRDSMALLESHKIIKKVLALELVVIHIHHGRLALEHREQNTFRDQAQKLVQESAQRFAIPCLTNLVLSQSLNSEAELRAFRRQQVQALLPSGFIAVTAHHQGDELENYFIRLIRGTGAQGLRSFVAVSPTVVRPFLIQSAQDIQCYASNRNLVWLEDPTNSQKASLRNWLRLHWLPQLEKKRSGSLSRMAQSLRQIGSSKLEDYVSILDTTGDVFLQRYLLLKPEDKRAFWAWYMARLNFSAYGSSHIAEVMRRLDRGPKRHKFKVLNRLWLVNESILKIVPLDDKYAEKTFETEIDGGTTVTQRLD